MLTTLTDERRRERRYDMEIAVHLAGGTGLTRNVSASGLFFETGVDLERGMEIRFELHVGAAYGEAYPLRFGCLGTVMRTESRPGGLGVAARIDGFFLLHPDYDAPPARSERLMQ